MAKHTLLLLLLSAACIPSAFAARKKATPILAAELRQAEQEADIARGAHRKAESALRRAEEHGKTIGTNTAEMVEYRKAINEAEKQGRRVRALRAELAGAEEEEDVSSSSGSEEEEVIIHKIHRPARKAKTARVPGAAAKKAADEEIVIIEENRSWMQEYKILASLTAAGIVVTGGLLIDLLARGEDSILYHVYAYLRGEENLDDLQQDLERDVNQAGAAIKEPAQATAQLWRSQAAKFNKQHAKKRTALSGRGTLPRPLFLLLC